jgi:hypothetical protein
LVTSGQIIGLLGFALIALDTAFAYLVPDRDFILSIILDLLLFGGMFFVVYCACENVEIPVLTDKK